jgi:hypothetical protein
MARYIVRVLDANASLQDHERAIQEAEELDWTAVSLAAGTVAGARANVVTLVHAIPSGTIRLVAIAGDGDDRQQSDLLTEVAEARAVVSYAGIFVGGSLANVAMLRE